MAEIPAGSRGYDALGDPASAAEMLGDGWMFRTFYIAQSSSMSTKITNSTWRQGLVRIGEHLAAGMGVLLNYESSTTRSLQGGAVGKADGAWSKFMCQQLGYPTSLPILVSFDTDTRLNGRVRPEAIAYGREFAAACAPYPIGIYGGTPIMHELADINTLGWKAMASSWSTGFWPRAVWHWQQRRPTTTEQLDYPYVRTPSGWALDVNVATKPFSAWGHEPTPSQPVEKPRPPGHTDPPGGDLMMTLFQPFDANAQFIGMTDQHGVAQFIEWTGDGGDPAVAARVKAFIDTGARVDAGLSIGGFKNCTLIGPLPQGDTLHTWQRSDFARVIP